MLADRYSPDMLRDLLSRFPTACHLPPSSDRRAWEALSGSQLNQQRRAWVIGAAEASLKQPWPELTASSYMAFARNGDREGYETPYFERRNRIGRLVLAECFENRGRFLDGIVDGLWLLIGEPTWCVPAHARRVPEDPLPQASLHSVDLFACETAAVIANTLRLLGDSLARISPTLIERLRHELEVRVVIPVETYDDLWWFSGRNNWTPWCAANSLDAALLVLDDPDRLAALAHRLMGAVDRFIDGYGDDGGCDEGPGYWGVAAGAMLVFLEHLYVRSGGAISCYAEPRIAAMGRFIVTAHLDGPWFVNFADAPAKCQLRRGVVWRYGERVGEPAMCALVASRMREGLDTGPVPQPFAYATGAFLLDTLRDIAWLPGELPEGPPVHQAVAWLPDIQVLVARQSTHPLQGLIVAAKGGHNAESHNHNDVGHFVAWLDGSPILVDIGVERYSRKTFSENRYDIWCIRGAAHCAPVINNCEQAAGKEYCARNIEFSHRDGLVGLAMDLQGTYPAAAGVASLRRSIQIDLERGHLTVTDHYDVAETPAILRMTFYTPASVHEHAEGTLRFDLGHRSCDLHFDPDLWCCTLEPVLLEDPGLRSTWGNLTRIELHGAMHYRDRTSQLRLIPADAHIPAGN